SIVLYGGGGAPITWEETIIQPSWEPYRNLTAFAAFPTTALVTSMLETPEALSRLWISERGYPADSRLLAADSVASNTNSFLKLSRAATIGGLDGLAFFNHSSSEESS